MSLKCYSELIKLPTFEERFKYLKLDGVVGADTFGYDRIFNQMFYSSKEWKRIRRDIIIRDNSCDLGVPGYDIVKGVYIHHMNPITLDDINNFTEIATNPEYLITVSFETHNAIHYGKEQVINRNPIERKPNDTCPWR